MNVFQSLLGAFNSTKKSNKASQNGSKNDLAVPQQEVASLYQRPRSFTDFLPWMEYIEDSQCFVLEDGSSLGAFLELTPIGTEAREGNFLTNLRDCIQATLTDSIPEHDSAPWVIQFFVQNEHDLSFLENRLANYGSPAALKSEYHEFYLNECRNHLATITSPGGLFKDSAVTGTRWRGQFRRVRVVIYRRSAKTEKQKSSLVDAEVVLNDTMSRVIASLEVAGLVCRRGTGEDFYRWLLSWFNPNPTSTQCESPQELIKLASYTAPEEASYGHDFAESLLLSCPQSDADQGVWWFDKFPHAFISIQNFRNIPEIGILTAEKTFGNHTYALFDRLPEHTILCLNVTIKSQSVVRTHVARIKRAAVGDSADAALTREDADAVDRQIARGNKLFPASMGLFVRGNDLIELRKNMTEVNALLLSNGFQPISGEQDLLPLDSYVRNLPMAHDPALDKLRRRSRYVFSKHLANVAPIYGRSRGTGHSGILFFNRGAEPLDFDPLHPQDRKKNAHMLILGPTGAGKSAMLVYLLQQMVARHRPRVFIIEAGGSFTLLGEHFKAHGLSVNQITLNPDANVSLPPFSDAIEALDADTTQLDSEQGDGEPSSRDRLGEMEIVARVMITGGDAREDSKVSRADRLLIRSSIIKAAGQVRNEGREQVLISDVVKAFAVSAQDINLPAPRQLRAQEMADAMALFTSGIANHFFNREGSPWPDVDVTILEMGLLAREGYEDQLTVAYLSMMSHINDLVEKMQHSDRPTLVVTDEGHLITTHPLLANYVVKITKMWRKLGAWFWIATQNLADFPDASKRMLNMMEWWLCLVMPKEEIDQIARFRELTSAQRTLLLSAKKEPGKYVEGVVLSDNLETLFRNVPPSLSLALAMTEKHEKAQRRKIMDELGCSEVEAAYEVAKEISRVRKQEQTS
ncbi:MAG: conjugative transfer ATPase [Gammaproteobacteria bacterium]|nr:conjugative transfer ATPase [Gammaproteobacteria bacterium]